MINGINHITISVKSIDSAFQFYKDVIELKPIMKSETSAYFLAGKVWIALVADDNYVPSQCYSHICFNVSKRNYKTYVNRIKDENIKEWQENKTEGDSLYILDDSGNKLEIHFSTLRNRIKDGKKNWGKNIEWYI